MDLTFYFHLLKRINIKMYNKLLQLLSCLLQFFSVYYNWTTVNIMFSYNSDLFITHTLLLFNHPPEDNMQQLYPWNEHLWYMKFAFSEILVCTATLQFYKHLEQLVQWAQFSFLAHFMLETQLSPTFIEPNKCTLLLLVQHNAVRKSLEPCRDKILSRI